ncbi:anthrone oxygenase family protein [Streptomyces sp. NPDC002676]
MKHLQTGVLLTATLFTGLMAGLFAAFSYSVMPGLARSSDHTLIEAMQGINKAIINPVFMLPYMGSIPLIGLAVFLAWRGQGRSALPWLIAALVLYLVAFMVTGSVSVPLNNHLADAGDPDHLRNLAAVRADFEHKWVTWNIVRALLHSAAFACLAWSLFVCRMPETEPSRASVPPAAEWAGSRPGPSASNF